MDEGIGGFDRQDVVTLRKIDAGEAGADIG